MKEILIKNVTILTMDDENSRFFGWVLLKNGKTDALGEGEPPACSEVLDGEGGVLTPGLIDIHSHIGLYEDGLGFEGADGNEDTDPATPHLRALDGVNPFDRSFREALEAGVTAAAVSPGSANPIGGTFLAMKTAGSKRIDKRIIKNPVAVKFALGENPKNVYKDKDTAPVTRMATAAIIREQLYKAKRYLDDMIDYESSVGTDDEGDRPEYDAKCEALMPLLKHEIPAHFHAHRADDIFTAIRLAKEFDIDYVIIHATEGHLIADELLEDNARTIVGPVISERCKPELRNHTIETAGILNKAGVPMCICTDHPVVPEQYLPLSAGLAVRGGLDRDEALKAITIYPAQITGIADRVGSIEVGKDADIVIFSGDPLSVCDTPDMVIVNGTVI